MRTCRHRRDPCCVGLRHKHGGGGGGSASTTATRNIRSTNFYNSLERQNHSVSYPAARAAEAVATTLVSGLPYECHPRILRRVEGTGKGRESHESTPTAIPLHTHIVRFFALPYDGKGQVVALEAVKLALGDRNADVDAVDLCTRTLSGGGGVKGNGDLQAKTKTSGSAIGHHDTKSHTHTGSPLSRKPPWWPHRRRPRQGRSPGASCFKLARKVWVRESDPKKKK